LFNESFVVVWDPTLVFEKDRLFATEGFKLIDDVEILENISSLATSSGGFSAVDVVDDSDAIDGDVEGLEVVGGGTAGGVGAESGSFSGSSILLSKDDPVSGLTNARVVPFFIVMPLYNSLSLFCMFCFLLCF